MTPDEALMHEWIVMGLPPEVYLQHCRMHIEKRRAMLQPKNHALEGGEEESQNSGSSIMIPADELGSPERSKETMHQEWNTYFEDEKVEEGAGDVPPSLTDTPGKAARESVSLPHTNVDFNEFTDPRKEEQN